MVGTTLTARALGAHDPDEVGDRILEIVIDDDVIVAHVALDFVRGDLQSSLDLLTRGRLKYLEFSNAANEEAIVFFERTLALDPELQPLRSQGASLSTTLATQELLLRAPESDEELGARQVGERPVRDLCQSELPVLHGN